MKTISIEKIKFSYIPLSSGKISIGSIVKLKNGISDWDACPIGTTFTTLDPICVGIEKLEEIEQNVNEHLERKNVLSQIEIDKILETIFGNVDYGFWGVDYCISVSCAVARVASLELKLPLWKYINTLYDKKYIIPKILSNVIGGGGHHKNLNQITETMILGANNVSKDIKIVLEIRQKLQDYFDKQDINTYIGLEGCIVPNTLNEFELISKLYEYLGCKTNLKIGLDLAGIYDNDKLKELLEKCPIIKYIEDPFLNNEANEDFYDSDLLVAGDDLLRGNLELIDYYFNKKIINSAVFKLNHLGTISNIIKAAKIVRSYNGKIICSQRSNETSRDTMSHIAIGLGADYLKFGSPVRERIANYSNLLFMEKIC